MFGMNKVLLISAATLLTTCVSTRAVAPTPEAIERWQAEGVYERKVANWKAFKERGGCSPADHSPFDKSRRAERMASDFQQVDTARAIVILVDFSDNVYLSGFAAGEPEQFDSILFSDRQTDSIFNPSGSMTDYYMEVSHGQFYIQGDIYGWYRMPNTYAYYENGDDGLTKGPELARHAVDAAEADGVDFSLYDSNNDGHCDGLIIIHAGRGAEEGGFGIWSHKANLSPAVLLDGVLLSNYNMNPEETGSTNSLSHIGVVVHEYGHFLGLPDLYDIDYQPTTSDGLGRWSLMASGNYLGGSKKPAHLDAWCKAQVGFISFTNVDANMDSAIIPAAEYNPVAYRLRNSFTPLNEYWIVENRQKTGFDIDLPGSGLCIYHVDLAAQPQNNDPFRYYVALEQADGKNDLAFTNNNVGDAGDPFPGSTNNRNFHTFSNPNSLTNVGGLMTRIGVWDISDNDSVMYADLDVDFSRPWISLNSYHFTSDPPDGDGDTLLEPGETVSFYCEVENDMLSVYNIYATLETDNPDVSFVTQTTAFNDPNVNLLRGGVAANILPIKFTMADSVTPIIDSFFLTITVDSLPGFPGTADFQKQFSLERVVGAPQILLVDDDGADSVEESYQEAFLRLRVPVRVWRTQISGVPSESDLLNYNSIFWISGKAASPIGTGDMAAMKTAMDNGLSVFLSTLNGIEDMHELDSSFMAEYFRAYLADSTAGSGLFNFEFHGVEGSGVGHDTKYFMSAGGFGATDTYILGAQNGGKTTFESRSQMVGKPYAVSYTGSHKSVILAFPAGYINNGQPGYDNIDTLLARTLDYFGGIATSVYDGKPFVPLPRTFELYQNYPNPFNPITTISYTLRSVETTRGIPPATNLSIYNILGQKVTTLVDQIQAPGTYSVDWDGRSKTGETMASGVYFYRLERGDEAVTRKMVLVK